MKFILIILTVLDFSLCSENCTKVNEYCNCDAHCSFYGDCCPGHNDFGKLGLLPNMAICKALNQSRNSNIWIIYKCKNKNDPLSDFCSKLTFRNETLWKSFIPVISNENMVYENAYCAKCNGVDKYTYANLHVTCPFKREEDEDKIMILFKLYVLEESSCTGEPEFREYQKRRCQKGAIDICPEYFAGVDNCVNGTIRITKGRLQSYKNEACCMCWNDQCDRPFNVYRKRITFSYNLNFNEWKDPTEKVASLVGNSTEKENSTMNYFIDNFVFYNSFIFTVISIISLSFLIILYLVNNIFHNFGGYLTICLGICMCLMNIITLLVTNTTIVQSNFCTPLAIIQHFMSISTFVWMSFYALDLLQTFGFKSFNVSKKKSLKTFGIYCIIGFGISSILVGTSTVIEFNMGDNSTIKPEYGGAHCWFTNKYGGIIWYFIPVCLMLMWNFGTCIVVFYRLVENSKECSVVQKRESNSTLWLCIRLTAVFGIGYVFQILLVLSNNEILIMLGATLNCLQGFLFTICFVCTKRVKIMFSKVLLSLSMSNSNSIPGTKTNMKQTTTTLLVKSEKNSGIESSKL